MAGTPSKKQTKSRLLGLPAELRSWIYELVATGIREVVVTSNKSTPSISDVQYPLSQTCRQLREEFSSYAVDAARNAINITVRCKNFDIPSRDRIEELIRSLPPKCLSVHIQATSVDDKKLQSLYNKIKDVLRGVTVTPWYKCPGGGKINATVKIEFIGEFLDRSSLQQAVDMWSEWGGDGCDCYAEDQPVGSAVLKALKDAVARYRGRRSGAEQRRLEEKRRLWCKRRAERE